MRDLPLDSVAFIFKFDGYIDRNSLHLQLMQMEELGFEQIIAI